MTGAEWLYNVAVFMPERWDTTHYVTERYAAPGSVDLSRPPELREALQALKSEDIQDIRPDLARFICCGRADWLRYERAQKDSELKLAFDRLMRKD